jgi:hypothetical protein
MNKFETFEKQLKWNENCKNMDKTTKGRMKWDRTEFITYLSKTMNKKTPFLQNKSK